MSLALIGGLGAILGDFFGLYLPARSVTGSNCALIDTAIVFHWYWYEPAAHSRCLEQKLIRTGNFLVLPIALAFGRRSASLMAATILCFSTVGAACQVSYQSFS